MMTRAACCGHDRRFSLSTHVITPWSRELLEKLTGSQLVKVSNFMKILPVRAELFQSDGRTDGQSVMTQLIVAFRYFFKTRLNIGNFRKKVTLFRKLKSIV